MEAPMALFGQEQRHLALAERHLDTANHCLARQLRALGTLGRLSADLSLAESVFATMLHTHTLMTEHKELIELALNNAPPQQSTKSKRHSYSPHSDVTVLLSKAKLQTDAQVRQDRTCFRGAA